MNRPLLSVTDEEQLRLGWQEVTSCAAEHMNIANAVKAGTWTFESVEDARQQSKRLAGAQWLFYARHINEWCGGPELR